MSSGKRHGKPDEEMFLQRPSNSDSPTVEPLRINKRDSRSPEYDHRPNFPLPPGASSSPAPLPYPDDRDRIKPTTNGRAPQVGFSDRTTTIGQSRPSPAPTSSPPPVGYPGSADARKYGRTEYPAALRPWEGREGPQPTSRLAERRGNIPKPLPDSPGPEAPDKEGLFQRLPQRDGHGGPEPKKPAPAENNPYPEYYQQYWPPPGENSSAAPTPA
ncbi:MAG: hypothetical protein L6R42_007403, partial [Xanthoria sp. 1 TBL-2021]